MVIDQFVNGQVAVDVRGDLSCISVQVERVVDIVQNLFKSSSALNLFDESEVFEVPHSKQQQVVQNLLCKVKSEYRQGQAHVNSLDLQL